MKFDGKEVRGTNVAVVSAPKKPKGMAVPIIIVAVLVIFNDGKGRQYPQRDKGGLDAVNGKTYDIEKDKPST